jgi:hypothetical protein
MVEDQNTPTERPDERPDDGDAPSIEDAYESDAAGGKETPEDDPDQLVDAIRYLADDTVEAMEEQTPEPAAGASPTWPRIEDDPADDAGSIPDDVDAQDAGPAQPYDWGAALSPHKVVVELKRIETQVRELLEGRDGKRKRKLSGSRRWRELEEDIVAWRHSGRVDEESLTRMHQLIVRRDYLFRRLRFLAGTRPTWNS